MGGYSLTGGHDRGALVEGIGVDCGVRGVLRPLGLFGRPLPSPCPQIEPKPDISIKFWTEKIKKIAKKSKMSTENP